MENNVAIKRFFKVFEVIVSLIVVNLIMIIGSILTLFVLTPVLIFGSFHMMNNLLQGNVDDMIMDYFRNITKGFWTATKYGYPILLAIILLLSLFVYVNPFVVDYLSIYFYGAIIGSQILLIYIFVSIFLLHLMSAIINPGGKSALEQSLLIAFAYPIRTIIGFLGMFLIPGFLVGISGYFLLIIIPIGINGYFIILRRSVVNLSTKYK